MKQLLLLICFFLLACTGNNIDSTSVDVQTGDTSIILVEDEFNFTILDSSNVSTLIIDSIGVDKPISVNVETNKIYNKPDGVLVVKVSNGELQLVEIESDTFTKDGTIRVKTK